jgi:DNA-binding response OmpR family regulator
MTGAVPVVVDVDRDGAEAEDGWGRSMMMPLTHSRSCRRMAIYGELVIDIIGERATIGEHEVMLQQSDWAILARLSAAGGTFVRGADLLEAIWGEDMRDDAMFLRSWIQRLNDRLGGCCSNRPLIDTIPGGYRLLSPVEWSAHIRYVTGQRTTRTNSNDVSASPETYIPSSIPARR